LPLRIQNGKWQYRFQVGGRKYFGSTDLDATEQNRTKAARKEAAAHRMVTEGRADLLKLDVRPFAEAASVFLEWAEGKHREHPHREHPQTALRLRVSFASLREFFRGHLVHMLSEGLIEDFASWRRREHQIRDGTIRHDLHAPIKILSVRRQAQLVPG
jgi:hypothetical protein